MDTMNIAGGEKSVAAFETLESRQYMSSVPLPRHDAVPVPSVQVREPLHVKSRAAGAAPVALTAGTGLTGEYFSDPALQTAYLLRTDSTIKFNSSIRNDPSAAAAQSIRWSGQVMVAYSESYSFSVVSNGGVRLWVDGQLLINQATSAGGNLRSTVNLNLSAGQKYDLILEYTRNASKSVKVQLNWASLHQRLGLIPSGALFSDPSVTLPAVSDGIIGQYFAGENFNQPVMQRVDPGIDFDFGSKSPARQIANGAPFSIRWMGQITAKYSQTYTFTTTSDDGVRLWVDDQLLIDNWTDHTAANNAAQITLVAGVPYDFRMDYYEDHYVATAQLRWSSASQPLEIIPASAFSSTPPATAGVLTATATGSASVHLAWTGSAAATGYFIQQSTDDGISYGTIGTAAAGKTDYDVTGLNPASSYLFRVTPLGSSSTSIPSNSVTIETATNSPGGITASAISPTSVQVNWSDVTGEAGFNIYASTPVVSNGMLLGDNAGYTLIGTVASGVTTFTATGLLPGSNYTFVVSALNAAGTVSDPGTPASATTPLTAPVDAPLAISSVDSITITWTDVTGATGFEVDRSITGVDGWVQIADTSAGVFSFIDTTTAPGIIYYYRVRDLNNGGLSDPSATVTAAELLTAPGGLGTSGITATAASLNWSDVTGEQGFVVLESTDGGNTFSQVGITAQGITSFAMANLTAGANYQFEVESLNVAGQASVSSIAASVVTVPATPASVVATALSASSAQLNWTSVTGATGYLLQRSTTAMNGWSTIATVGASTQSYVDSALSAGCSYFYRLQATNTGGTSTASGVTSVLTIPAVPVPSLTGLSTSQSQVSWAAVTGASQYVVQRSADGSTGWTTVATVSGSLSATVPNLVPSTQFYYRVTAVNASGSSAQSVVVNQMTAPAAQYALNTVIYGTTAAGGVYSVDTTSGAATFIGQLPVTPAGIGRNPINGELYFYKDGTGLVYTWDPATGNIAQFNNSALTSASTRGAFRPDGNTYVTTADGMLHLHNASTGLYSTIGQLNVAGVALPNGTGNMCYCDQFGLLLVNNGSLYSVNTSNAAATLIASSLIGNYVMTFGQKEVLYSTNTNGQLLSINPATAVATVLGNANALVFNGLTASPLFTHLSVTASASPTSFTRGANANYSLQVSNTLGDATASPVTVVTTLPAGLSFVSASGTGWTASVSGQLVTLTYTAGLAANSTLPVATLTVAVASSAPSAVTSVFSVSSPEMDSTLLPLPATVISPVS